jgi:hypothetical protein
MSLIYSRYIEWIAGLNYLIYIYNMQFIIDEAWKKLHI